MKKFISFVAMMLLALCAQAQVTEVSLFNSTKVTSYVDGDVISSANASLTLGNDMKGWTKGGIVDVPGTYLTSFSQTVIDEETGTEGTKIVYVAGQNNPKDEATSGKGSGINCAEGKTRAYLPQNGTYYIFKATKNGKVQIGLKWGQYKPLHLIDATDAYSYTDENKGKTYLAVDLPSANLHNYVVKDADGNNVTLIDDDEEKGGKVYTGYDEADNIFCTLEFDVLANCTYYFFCRGSKLGCFGYKFTPVKMESTVPAPTFSPESGETVEYGSTIEVNYENGLLLYYTTDESDPEDFSNSSVKSGISNPEEVTVDMENKFVIKAYVEDPQTNQRSDVVTATFTVTGKAVEVGVPSFTPEPGAVEAGTWVTIEPGENGQNVTWTTDGRDPHLYGDQAARGRVQIKQETTIRAFSQDGDGHNSEEVAVIYTIAEPAPVAEVTFNPASGTEVEEGDEITISFDGDNFQCWVTTDGSDPASSLTAVNIFPDEKVIVVPESGQFVVKAMLERNGSTSTENEKFYFEATYPVKAAPVPEVTFDPASGTEVEEGDEITISFDGDNFQCWVTTDGSDPASSLTAVNIFPDEKVIVVPESGQFVVKAMLERNGSTESEKFYFDATYPVKAAPVPEVTFDPASGTEVEEGDEITISFDGDNFQCWVTTDGSDPASSLTAVNIFPDEKVIVVPQSGQFVVKAMLERNGSTSTESEKFFFDATYPVKAAPVPEVTFDPASGTEVEEGDEITISFDGENFQCWVTTDGSDPASSLTAVNIFPDEKVIVVPQSGQFVVKAMLERNGSTSTESEKFYFDATYPVKAAPVPEVTFDPASGTEVEEGDEITINFDGDNFQCWVTTDGSDPASSLTAVNIFPDEKVIVVPQSGQFVVKAMLERNGSTSTESEKFFFDATYPVKAAPVPEVTFDPASGTEVEEGDEITISFDGENFQCWVTTDGSDPTTSLTAQNIFPDETVTVEGEGEFVVKAALQRNGSTSAQDEWFNFEATYPIKALAVAEVTFDPESGTEVEVGDEITISFDGENFQCWVTTDGSDPATSLTAQNIFPEETVTVEGEGEFVVKAALQRNGSTSTQDEWFNFEATYPIKVTGVVIETAANGYGTFCYDKDLDFSGDDVHAYVARLSGNNVFLTEVTEVPAFTGILVKSEYGENSVTVPFMEEAAPITAQNDFIGVLEDTNVEAGTCSVLSLIDNEEGFYKFLGTVIPANKAYFPTVANNANAKLSLIFDDVDGIKAIISDAIVEGKAYNLNGQRVYDSYKGIVIVNGKKYVKK